MSPNEIQALTRWSVLFELFSFFLVAPEILGEERVKFIVFFTERLISLPLNLAAWLYKKLSFLFKAESKDSAPKIPRSCLTSLIAFYILIHVLLNPNGFQLDTAEGVTTMLNSALEAVSNIGAVIALSFLLAVGLLILLLVLRILISILAWLSKDEALRRRLLVYGTLLFLVSKFLAFVSA